MLFKLSNTNQLFLIFILFSILLSVVHNIIEDTFFQNSAKKVALDNAIKKTAEREGVFQNFIYSSEQTLKALRENESFINYLNTQTNEDEIQRWFLSFSQSHVNFMQLRYIDKNGL
ncbi:MAG: hypothetical protein JXQ66_00275 [Campylobacterales bacterium]|nr:hypothetical protein [Campylobacterales bacterium]